MTAPPTCRLPPNVRSARPETITAVAIARMGRTSTAFPRPPCRCRNICLLRPDRLYLVSSSSSPLSLLRSEEHTSELQSLMRISYAVFCLKKKKQKAYNQKDYNTHK